MKTAIAAFLFLSFIVCFTFLCSVVYGLSPKLKTELFTNKIENYIYYGINDGYNNNTLKDLEKNINLDRVYVTSNATHLEIKLLFNDFLDRLKNLLLNNNTVPQNLFINIFIDSDDDETTGFLGYNYKYLLTHNVSNSYNDNNLTSAKKNFTQDNIHNNLKQDEIREIIARTLNSKEILEKLDWVIKGYELLDLEFQPLFFSSKVNEKSLSAIPDGFKVTLDLNQIGYPSNYALLVEVGRELEDYMFSHVFGKVHVPRPNLILEDKKIDIANGKNSVILDFNNTGLYNLNVKAELLNNSNSDDNLVLNFSQGNQFNLLSEKGVLPIDVIVDSNYKQKNLVIPLNLSYSVIGENDLTESGFNNSLTHENIYNKIVYLNFNLNDERNRLINFDEIPPQYIAVFIGAIFSFFIPSIMRSTNEYFQKRTANKYLKNILKQQSLSDNPNLAIKNIMSISRILKHEFIKGKITKDHYEILKENIADVIKDLVSKKTNNTTTAYKE